MSSADYVVFIAYLAGMLAIGVFYAARNTDLRAMFAANGQSPWWVAGLSAFMTMFSAGTFVVWGGLAYRHGFVAVVINLGYGVAALLVGRFVAAKWKELGITTPSQFVLLRFNASVVTLYTVVIMVFRVIGSGTALYALAVLLAALISLPEGHILADPVTGNASVAKLTILFGIIVIAYTMAGGLWAVLMTDVLQFIILNLAVLFILPLILGAAGGPAAALDALPDAFFSLTGGGYGLVFIVGWAAIHVFMIGAEWAFAQRFLSVPTPRDAQRSAYLFGALYLVSPLLWLAPPLLYRAINPSADPEQAYILAAQAVLPAGLVGLVIAAMFSATASLVSSQLNVFAGVLTQAVTRGARPAREEVMVGRAMTVLIGLFIMGLGLAVPYLGGAEKLIVSATSLLVGPLLAPSLWALLSPRIGASAVWASVAAAASAGLALKVGLAPAGVLTTTLGLSGVAGYLAENAPTVDLLIGVVTPLVVLTAFHFASPQRDPGADRIDRVRAQAPSAGGSSDRSAGYVVAAALGISAVIMLGLGVISIAERGVLLLFGGALFALAALSALVARAGGRSETVGIQGKLHSES